MNAFNVLGSVLILLFSVAETHAETPIKVTTTLSTYADIVKAIGKDLVAVKYVASPKFNPHFIEPKPSDVFRVKNAHLFVHSGLDLEAWRGPLVDAAARGDFRQSGEHQLDLSSAIQILEVPDHNLSRSEGDIHIFGNPHFWLDPRNGKIIAQEISQKLAEFDASHKDNYERNLKEFSSALDRKISDWKLILSPYSGKEFIGYHNDWIYLMNFTGLSMKQFLEPKPGIPPTPKHIEFIKDYIRENKIKGIIQATFYPTEASFNIADQTGAKVLLLCQNVGELSQASDYISMLNYNISQIAEVLKGE